MKKRRSLWICTVIAACLDLCGVVVSVSMILYGIYQHRMELFQAGNKLVYLWMLNPIPLILSVFGLIYDRERRKKYCAWIVLTSLAWLVGGFLIALHF